eukprot:9631064-Ditylum_brightwellii.AAC.1
MCIRDCSNILSLECLENTLPDIRIEYEPLFLHFLNHTYTGSRHSQIGGSTDGESIITDESQETSL